MVADVTSSGDVRACASFDVERLEAARVQLSALKVREDSSNHLAQYIGTGYIAFTVDQDGSHMDRYQGIVELKGASLVECVQHYFAQSEQIGTGIKMAVGQRDGAWRAGGLMLQHMPEDDGNIEAGASNLNEDDWRRSMLLMDSCTEDEFLDPILHSNVLLMRLFHEESVRVFEPLKVQKKCRCSRDRVTGVLAMMSDDDLDYMNEDGQIIMRCEFCGTGFEFWLDAVKAERAQAKL